MAGCQMFAFASIVPIQVLRTTHLTSSKAFGVSATRPLSRYHSHIQGHVSVVRATIPSPPNNEADWVIVDVGTADMPSEFCPPSLVNNVQDDAKSLIRVALRDASAELSVVLCSDAHIRKLNAQWRGKDSATDVLSFPQDDPDRVVLGDIVISIDAANRQAVERDYLLRDELRVLLVHGALHLLGYDHEGEKEGDWLVVRISMFQVLGFHPFIV